MRFLRRGGTTRSPAALFTKGEPCDYVTTIVGCDGDNDAEWQEDHAIGSHLDRTPHLATDISCCANNALCGESQL